MDECLSAVLNTQESHTDEMFAHQVRLQLIAQRVAESSDASEGPRAPLPFYLNTFRSQMKEVQQSLSPEAKCNGKSLPLLF
jgi:hypothetical protein